MQPVAPTSRPAQFSQLQADSNTASAAPSSAVQGRAASLPELIRIGDMIVGLGQLNTSLSGAQKELLDAVLRASPETFRRETQGDSPPGSHARTVAMKDLFPTDAPARDLPPKLRVSCELYTSQGTSSPSLARLQITDLESKNLYCNAGFEPVAAARQRASSPLANALPATTSARQNSDDTSKRTHLISSLLCCFAGKVELSNDQPMRSMPTSTNSPTATSRPPASVAQATRHVTTPSPGMNFFTNRVGEQYFAQSQPRVAVDLGAGGGRDTRYLAGKNCRVDAVDPDPVMKGALAAEAGPRLRTITDTLRGAAFENDSIDLINAQRVLPFIHGEDLKADLRESFRILKPGGHLSASFFETGHSWNKQNKPKLHFDSEATVRSLLHDAGFEMGPDDCHVDNDRNHKAANGEIVENWKEIWIVATKPQASS
ncbi:hypothetical protein BVH03_15560 [Pseudomonas sp. PA15(2017)]|uniref:class I SAM-dependent methyltransferase n=1 Tax=Pseudomonas sp. PA15(2017) TaxID=1932111 RepID=UPI000961EE19|nr:methyltransferase domain-containing protein [Pseudomonas sp. PA15(2017)]OLU26737.1 hypothetical protein BVH03_15560 [Pseudomonas sp. PA15(2017)]